ncbi:hypothetical protein ACTXT7_000544, partial [Hymenolepis weldensis]
MYEHRDQSEAWSFAAVYWLIISHVYSCCRRKAAANGAATSTFSPYCGIYHNPGCPRSVLTHVLIFQLQYLLLPVSSLLSHSATISSSPTILERFLQRMQMFVSVSYPSSKKPILSLPISNCPRDSH